MAEQDDNARPGDNDQPESNGGAPDPAKRQPPATGADPEGALDDAQGAVDELRDAAEHTPPPDDAEERAGAALKAAKDAIDAAKTRTETAPTGTAETPGHVDLPTFQQENGEDQPAGDIDLLSDVNLHVKIELGRTRMFVEDVLRLAQGSVVELDKLAGDPVDVYVNDRHVARGEVLVVNDNFCVRISEIITASPQGEEPAPTK
ncbi:MAG: flagellar motor switch protein FliN [Phycisphaerales bacterium]|nr:MAG: flagellar motor switch protein FliN [Phycisphaerales bacterium]